MTYTKYTWVSGSTLTAARMNNLETQYDQVAGSFYDKYSTASTGTVLLSLGATGTYSSGVVGVHALIYIPPGVEMSRFELSYTGKCGTTNLQRAGLFRTLSYTTVHTAYPNFTERAIAYTEVGYSTHSTGEIAKMCFSAMGGDVISFEVSNPQTTTLWIWDMKLCATSTTITTPIPQNMFYRSTALNATPSTAS